MEMELEVSNFNLDDEFVIKAAQPLFYGYVFLTGVMLTVTPKIAGTFLGIGIMSGISLVAASLADSLDGSWKNLIEVIAVSTLLMSILAASYSATYLSFALA